MKTMNTYPYTLYIYISSSGGFFIYISNNLCKLPWL